MPNAKRREESYGWKKQWHVGQEVREHNRRQWEAVTYKLSRDQDRGR